jgi:hypothetical protein
MGQEPADTSTGQEPEAPESLVGRRYWLIGDRLVPQMAGAEEDDEEDEDETSDDSDDEEEEDDGKRKKRKPETFDRAYVEKIRREAADARKRAQTAEAKIREREDSEKSELEKAQAAAKSAADRAEALEAKLRKLNVRTTIEREARKLGFVDEDVAYRLVDTDDLDLDDDGVPTNATELLEEILKKRPYLKASGDDEERGERGKKNGVPSTPKNKGGKPTTREEDIEKTKEEMRASGRYRL